jgi:GNAT superfamily N-acetyltransferase
MIAIFAERNAFSEPGKNKANLLLMPGDLHYKVMKFSADKTIEQKNTGQKSNIVFRHELKPGDAGNLIHLHGILYDTEYGYDNTFEAYVARGLADFIQSYNPARERIWLAENDGKIIGSIAIVKFTEEEAQLRWYLLYPDYRGKGLGKRLLGEAIKFCRDRNYKRIFLKTTSDLKAAAHLYMNAGFVKTQEESHENFGKFITEERYDMTMGED